MAVACTHLAMDLVLATTLCGTRPLVELVFVYIFTCQHNCCCCSTSSWDFQVLLLCSHRVWWEWQRSNTCSSCQCCLDSCHRYLLQEHIKKLVYKWVTQSSCSRVIVTICFLTMFSPKRYQKLIITWFKWSILMQIFQNIKIIRQPQKSEILLRH